MDWPEKALVELMSGFERHVLAISTRDSSGDPDATLNRAGCVFERTAEAFSLTARNGAVALPASRPDVQAGFGRRGALHIR